MRIYVGGAWRPIDSIDTIDARPIDETERAGIHFIREWQAGKHSFTFHTSGSTSAPKPISFRRDQLMASAKLSIESLQLKPGMNVLVCLDPRFVAGALMLVRCLVNSMNIILQRPSSRPFSAWHETVDLVALVPMQVDILLKEDLAVLDRPMIVIIGGAPLNEQLARKLQHVKATCYATYGMTETLTHIALRKLNGPGKQHGFHLLPGIEAKSNEQGCLVIQAPHLDATLVTHDLAEWLTPDSFRILGRSDEVINSGGVKIHPTHVEGMVERAMDELGHVFRFFIAGRPDASLGEHVCLIIEGKPLAKPVEAALLGHINQWLSPYERPRQVEYITQFAETTTQKIDRRTTLARLK